MQTEPISPIAAIATFLSLLLHFGAASSAEFDTAPEPDFRTLFKMYMAEHGDVLDTPDVAYEHHLLFDVPTTGRYCVELNHEWSDEFKSADLIARVRPPFSEALLAAASAPKTAVFRVRAGEMDLGEYDLTGNKFPLTHILNPLTSIQIFRPDDACQTFNSKNHLWEFRALVPQKFELVYSGTDKIDSLPMSQSAARAYISAHTEGGTRVNRKVILELVVETEPVPLHRGSVQAIPARILAARLLDPNDFSVVHTYASSLFESRTSQPSVVATQDAVPLTSFMQSLLTVKKFPELLDEEWLIEIVAGQISSEQRRWREFDTRTEMCRQVVPCKDERTAILVFEWQRLEKENPEFANGEFLDVFVRPDLPWEFVSKDPQFDERFGALAEVFIFQRDAIEGREPEFAARALRPVWKRHFLAALERLPTEFTLSSELITPEYDFSSSSFPLTPNEILRPVPNPRFVMPPASERTGYFETILPAKAKTYGLYQLRNLPEPRAVRGFTEPGRVTNLTGGGAADSWRTSIQRLYCKTCELDRAGFYPGMVVAFDRSLALDAIYVPVDEAEQMIDKLAYAKESIKGMYKIRTRVTFEIEAVEFGNILGGDAPGTKTPVLFGRLQQVELKSMVDEPVALMAADNFQNAAEMIALASSKKLADEQRLRAENERAENTAQLNRDEVNLRFAQCEAMVTDLAQMRACTFAIQRDQEKLRLNQGDIARLGRLQRTLSVQQTSTDHLSDVQKMMQQMQTCMALADAVEKQSCIEAAQAR